MTASASTRQWERIITGMTIMEERARNLGGQLSVENLPAAGTRVTLHFMPTARRDILSLPTEQFPPSL